MAEQLLRESEEKYRELVENANNIILKWDKNGNITFFNEYAQRFFGYTSDEITGKPVMGTIVPATESGSDRDLRLMIDDIIRHPGDHTENENENITRDGRRVWIRWQNKPLFNENGQFTGLFSIGTDITERKRAKEALQESEIRSRSSTRTIRSPPSPGSTGTGISFLSAATRQQKPSPAAGLTNFSGNVRPIFMQPGRSHGRDQAVVFRTDRDLKEDHIGAFPARKGHSRHRCLRPPGSYHGPHGGHHRTETGGGGTRR